MKPEVIDATISVINTAGLAGLVLPGIDKAWESSPNNKTVRHSIRYGGKIYLLIILLLGGLQTAKTRSIFPLAVGLAVAGVILYSYERALGTDADY